jgi:riboflavin synthase
MTSTPILEVFVHEDESDDPEVLAKVFEDRSRKHARNAYWMLFDPEQLSRAPVRAFARASTTRGRSRAH